MFLTFANKKTKKEMIPQFLIQKKEQQQKRKKKMQVHKNTAKNKFIKAKNKNKRLKCIKRNYKNVK